MPRKLLKKVLPTHEKIKEQRFLKIFGSFLHRRELWRLSRKKVITGVFIGIFVAALPMPLQMVLTATLAIIFSANLPISFVLIFISNPLTMPPLFFLEYKIGNFFLRPENPIEFNFESMYDNFGQIALSLWSGALILGVVCATICAITLNYLWIYSVRKNRKASQFNKI